MVNARYKTSIHNQALHCIVEQLRLESSGSSSELLCRDLRSQLILGHWGGEQAKGATGCSAVTLRGSSGTAIRHGDDVEALLVGCSHCALNAAVGQESTQDDR